MFGAISSILEHFSKRKKAKVSACRVYSRHRLPHIHVTIKVNAKKRHRGAAISAKSSVKSKTQKHRLVYIVLADE